MKLVTYDSMNFIVDADSDVEAVERAMEGNLAFLEAWKDNPPDERYDEYVDEARKESTYVAEELTLTALDELIRCAKYLYMGKHEEALVFNE